MRKSDLQTARELAESVKRLGGTAYFVGGFVRDLLRGIESADIDIEVHGITAEALSEVLEKAGAPKKMGVSIGIFSLKGRNIDIALPRTERSFGLGHRDFSVYTDPFIGEKAAARRRDFTVNSLMQNILTGEILDFFGGKSDIEKKILRHTDSASFPDDPLRVLRLAQFAARFGFSPAGETLRLCRKIDLSALSRERVFDELKKAVLKAEKPSVFFEVLRSCGALDFWFPELKAIIGVEQRADFHPEGDVWTHTMQVLDRAAGLREKSVIPEGLMLAALCHDFGKAAATKKINGKITSYNHEQAGQPAVQSFLNRLTGSKKLHSAVMNLTLLHMRPNALAAQNSGIKATNRLFDSALFPEELILLSGCDSAFRHPEYERWLYERLKIYEKIMSEPYVTGKDLLAAGIAQDGSFSDLMKYAHRLRLAGVDRETALKQTVGYAAARCGRGILTADEK